jgi:hypothetical protein
VLVQSVGVERQDWLVVSLHTVVKQKLVDFGFVSLALDVEVRQVLPSVDPVANGSLDFQDNWYQYLLDHF